MVAGDARRRGWLAALPGIAAECAERWELRLGSPFEPASISLVVPAERRDGTRAVLKIRFPEAESEQEASALAHWGGDGAVRLLEADAERAALLIERLEPALLDLAAGLSRDLLASAGERVVLHQDLRGGNVLLDDARGWPPSTPSRCR